MKRFTSIAQMQNEAHKTQRLLVSYKGTVYDVTDFVQLHPGGRGPIMNYNGRDLENVLFNPAIHRHGKYILQTLEKYKCGTMELTPLNNSTMIASKTTSITISNKELTNKKTQPTKPGQQFIKSATQHQQRVQQPDQLNQSFSKLNQSMTQSQKSQFLTIPNQTEILKKQKERQARLMQEWKQKEAEEIKRQQSEILLEQQQGRRVQSEIYLPNSKNESGKKVNSFYQDWLEKQQKQKLQQQSQIVQPTQKKVNPFYENWKKQQETQKQQIQKLSESIIMEENESMVSPVNNSFQRSYSAKSLVSVVQENPQLYVPVFSPKLLVDLKTRFRIHI